MVGVATDIGGVNELTAYTTTTNSDILYRLFLHLLEEQPDFTEHPPSFAPRLAESWEFSEDRKTLTFHLRDDVRWSDGVPVTAEDVRFSWKAQTHPEVAWEASYFKDFIADVEVVDPHTVRFHYTRIYPAQLLHANEGMILPKHVWGQIPFSEWRQSARFFRENMVTDGPYQLASWKPGEEIVLVANEDYYEEGLPRIGKVVFRIVPDQTALMTQLLSGAVDFVSGISPEDAERVAATPNLELVDYWSIGYIFIAWNNDNPLFSSVRVRQALTLAIDRFEMIETLWGEHAQLTTSPIVPAVWAHNDAIEPWPYDPKRARRLLAEAGWRDRDGDGVLENTDGRPFRFEILVHSGNRERRNAAIMAQQQLAEIGIEMRPRLLDFTAFVVEVNQGTFDACITGMSMGTDLDLQYFFHSKQMDGGLNYARYSNPQVDELLEQANRQRRPEQMKPYLDEIQRLLHHDQPITFLWNSKRLTAINKRIRGAEPNILSPFDNLREWWLEP